MLQILKLAFSNAPAAPRDPEPTSDPLAASFAGCLAQASLRPVPTNMATPPSPEREAGPEPVERAAPSEASAAAVARTRPDAKPAQEEAAPSTERTPKEPEAKAESKSETAPKTPQEAQKPAHPTETAATAQAGPTVPTSQPQVAPLPQILPEGAAPVAASDPKAANVPTALGSPEGLTLAQAETGLANLAPGTNLHFQFSEGAPETPTAKPALTELLSVPKPEMEVPLPADQAFKALRAEQLAQPSPEPPPTAAPVQPSLPQVQAPAPQIAVVRPEAPQIAAVIKEAAAPVTSEPIAAEGPKLEPSLRVASEARAASRPEVLPTFVTPLAKPTALLRLEVPEPIQRRASPESNRSSAQHEDRAEAPKAKETASAAPSAERTPVAPQAKPIEQTQDLPSPVLNLPRSAGSTTPPPAASNAGWVTTPVTAAVSRTGVGLPQLPANPALAQVEGGIRWMLKHQEKSAEIMLNPESLGRVVIKLRVEGGEVHARMWASEASTVPLLQDQRSALEASLRQQGLSLGSFDLHQGHRGQDASQAQPRFESGANFAQSITEKQEVPTALPVVLDGSRLIEVLA